MLPVFFFKGTLLHLHSNIVHAFSEGRDDSAMLTAFTGSLRCMHIQSRSSGALIFLPRRGRAIRMGQDLDPHRFLDCGTYF